MSLRLPRFALLVLAGLLLSGAAIGYAASSSGAPPAAPATTAATVPALPDLSVPDVRGQVYVFAESALQEAGFGWAVAGAVKGYSANVVVAQSPAPGTSVVDTGAPVVTLTLKRNPKYPEVGQAVQISPFKTTPLRLAQVASAPVAPAVVPTGTKSTSAAPATAPRKRAAAAKHLAKLTAKPQRVPAFVVPGARKEPLDEIPLTERAQRLGRWIDSKPARTPANVNRWLYQNAWVVQGASMGWWHGAEALVILIGVDRRTQRVWGIGARSEQAARAALADVRAKSR
jgi:hypothetical protein